MGESNRPAVELIDVTELAPLRIAIFFSTSSVIRDMPGPARYKSRPRRYNRLTAPTSEVVRDA
jgi:hypothetical protein